MGIVKVSDQLHENLRLASQALSRSINAQAEHWMRIGMLAELYPELSHSQLCQRLIQAELAGGLDLARLAVPALPALPTRPALAKRRTAATKVPTTMPTTVAAARGRRAA